MCERRSWRVLSPGPCELEESGGSFEQQNGLDRKGRCSRKEEERVTRAKAAATCSPESQDKSCVGQVKNIFI